MEGIACKADIFTRYASIPPEGSRSDHLPFFWGESRDIGHVFPDVPGYDSKICHINELEVTRSVGPQ